MAAVRQLTESGESVNVDSVRSITGGGSNERVAALIKECQAELKADEAQLLAINPSLAKLGSQLFERAVLQIVAEVERDAKQRVKLIEVKAANDVDEARQQERVALGAADRAERERDELREECEHLRQSAAIADGKLAQLAAQLTDERQRAAAQLTEERDRAAAAIERAEAAKVKAQSEAAEARGEITALRTQLRELQNELAAVRAQAKKGGGK
jgi:chromosome segregation ATPase